MKKITKLCLIIICFFITLTITGCKNNNVEGKLEDLMPKVYENLEEDELPMLANTEVTEENIEYYLGSADIEYEEALASEPMMSSIAHSVVLVRVKEGTDIEETKTKIKENVDPRKWLCVGVEEEDVIVKNKGNLIILIMVEDENNREKIEEGFDNL